MAGPQCHFSNEKENYRKKIFVIDLGVKYKYDETKKNIIDYEKGDNPLVFINPKLTFSSKDTIYYDGEGEGCLSVPNERYKVERYKDIVIEYYDQDLKKRIIDTLVLRKEVLDNNMLNEKSLKKEMAKIDLLSICIQHEYDHLEGILIDAKGRDVNILQKLEKKKRDLSLV